MANDDLIPAERIERAILLIRGQKVMLDSDRAELYGVETKQFTRQMKRNTRWGISMRSLRSVMGTFGTLGTD